VLIGNFTVLKNRPPFFAYLW